MQHTKTWLRSHLSFPLPFPLSVALFPSNARLLSSLDCNCNGIFMQNNCLLSTAQRDTEHAQPVQAGRQAGRRAGRAEFPWLQLTIEAKGEWGEGTQNEGQWSAWSTLFSTHLCVLEWPFKMALNLWPAHDSMN